MDPWFLLPFPTSAPQNASAPPCTSRGAGRPTAGCQVVQVVIDASSASRGTQMTFPAQLDLIKQLWSDKPVLFIDQPISTQTIQIHLKHIFHPKKPRQQYCELGWRFPNWRIVGAEQAVADLESRPVCTLSAMLVQF